MHRHPLELRNSSIHRERDRRALSRLGLQLAAPNSRGGLCIRAKQIRSGSLLYEAIAANRKTKALATATPDARKGSCSSPASLELAARQLVKPLQPDKWNSQNKKARTTAVAAALIVHASFNRCVWLNYDTQAKRSSRCCFPGVP